MGIHKLCEERAFKELRTLNRCLQSDRLAIFFIAKKLAGKGTYSKILTQLTNDAIVHIAIGDLVRAARELVLAEDGKQRLIQILEGKDLASLEFDDIVDFIVDHSNKRLLPTELIVALLEAEVEKYKDKSVVIDGFPRTIEQIKYAKRLINKFANEGVRSLFVEVCCPEEVLQLRKEGRRVCAECQTSRNIELLLTKTVGYDPESKECFLICDNPKCSNVRMIQKRGDEEGYSSVRERNRQTAELMVEIKKFFKGDVIEVRNAIPVNKAEEHDQKDFTQRAFLKWDPKRKKVKKEFGSLVVTDDDGKTKVLSRYAEPVVVDLVKGIVRWLKKRKSVV